MTEVEKKTRTIVKVETKDCPKCGKPNFDVAHVCSHCGAKLEKGGKGAYIYT